MTDKIDVKQINPDSRIQRELSTVGNGDTIIEKKEVDSDGDGYLDCQYFRNPAQFMEWQNELFKVGLIHRLHPPCFRDGKKRALEFDYLRLETVEGRQRVFAYFAEESRAQLFKTLSGLSTQELTRVAASSIERTDTTPRDNIDPNRLIPDKFNRIIDEVNRPEKGFSQDTYYYRVDVTDYMGIPADRLAVINGNGLDDANCFNATLYFSGVTDRLGHVYERELFPIFEDSRIFQPTTSNKPGDLVVWYRQKGDKKIPVHTFIDLGFGWVLSKNGAGNAQPYRFQRIEHARHLYSQERVDYRLKTVPLREGRYRAVPGASEYLEKHPELLHLIPF